ncbi:MAG: MCE family protein [Actinomycetota bacterium]|nr:MCE family protein [Actinomycetota bacterium]
MSAVRVAIRAVVVLAVIAGAVAGVTVAVAASDGAFAGSYQVVGTFPAAGQGLHPGSEVTFDGVQVGRVGSIALAGQRARITLVLQHRFRLPRAATATIRPQNLFGAEEIALTSPHGDAGPWVAAGATVARTAISNQIADLFAVADPLLSKVDAADLSASLSELDQATSGEGPRIASGLSAGSRLAGLLATTIGAQLHALDSLTAFSAAVAPDGAGINAVAGQANAALPAINAAEAAYQHLLDTLTPLAHDVAQFLAAYRPDIGALLQSGDNVTRVLVAHQSDIEALVRGLYQYVTKIALAASGSQTLPDGSKFAYFRTFIEFSDVNNLVCNLIAPAAPSLSYLVPLQQALGASGSAFDCSAQVSTFNSLQRGTATTTTPPSTPAPAAATLPTGTGALSAQGAAVAGQLYQALGAPQAPAPHTLAGYLSMLLGAG